MFVETVARLSGAVRHVRGHGRHAPLFPFKAKNTQLNFSPRLAHEAQKQKALNPPLTQRKRSGKFQEMQQRGITYKLG